VTTRTGIGYDSHRFAPGSTMRLGGITIHGDLTLAGHSDGDAIAHAITDAILGGAALGDIGEMFPDTEPGNRGRDSLEMLSLAAKHVRSHGWQVAQVDVTVVAERPKLSPHRDAMRSALAGALGVTPSAVSVKGKTNEGLGWIGRGEGLACFAVATLLPAEAE
jgi:2-C-methyl-D-erythritol 2,4-cyclodiphosphate synthase